MVLDRAADSIAVVDYDGANATTTPYRPENVLLFLACQPDLDAYLQKIKVPGLANQPIAE